MRKDLLLEIAEAVEKAQSQIRKAHETWNFVNNNGGNVLVDDPEIQRPQWQLVKDVLDGKLPLSTLSSDCE
ncbi:hypothetical protein FXV77_12280 [Sphingobacterium phlebotomi]|uniref:Uncharacterized protein n=1 Tax=Sphingobacterium phlebotomi TaxID=2605433 RepID=A0A5D4H4U5_9SPHI|nr:hypothetical protein [Sphingobacterium phlebotomi]TYR35846.1 hypothetical protein FXV77_12280 [Sphingobacterium phlebotomi]